MTQAEHTPGPWEAINDVVRSPMPVGCLVARCATHFESAAISSQEQTLANARLIAAAPEMATEGAALQLAIDILLLKIAHVTGVEPERRQVIQMQERFAAALAKAEGRGT